MKHISVIFLVVMSLLMVACGLEQTPVTNTPEPEAEMPNPASAFCVDQGYQLEIRDGEGGQIGYCLFSDGSECEEWSFFRGECAPGGEEELSPTENPEIGLTPTAFDGLTIEPLMEELCNGQAQAMSHILGDLVPTVTKEPLSDPVSGAIGKGCQSLITGSGLQFESPGEVVNTMAGMLENQGWIADPMFVANGPTGMAAGYRKSDQICLASAMWEPDESANCSENQPISACEVTPDQQNYIVTLNCGMEVADKPASSAIPLMDALVDLEPQDVFQNFYEITQIPRPSGHIDQIREFLVNFGQEHGLETFVDEAGNVIIRKPAVAGMENHQGVVLQSHMDMVPTKDDDLEFDFTKDPIQAVVSGDYIATSGTTLGADDGIGMAMILAVLQSGTLQTGPLEGLFTVDEETDMSGANGLKGDVLQGSILINLDSEWDGVFLIGAAGGGHVNVNSSYLQVPAPAELVSYQIKVHGLKGGHSGVDINMGRGNAIKLLARLLKGSFEPYQLRLASLSGGTAANAIAREATAVVFLPDPQVNAFSEYVHAFETTIKSELSATDPELSIEMTVVEPPALMMDEEFQLALINALYGNPQGVMRMSDALPDLVETSNNLGVVNAQEGQLEVVNTPRSSVDSALEDVSQMIASVWELAGYKVTFADYYPGWNPNPESPILDLMKATYQDLYNQEPGVIAVHAGLECGVIGAKYPQMDMISIGPTLNDVHSPTERLFIPSVGNVMNLLLEVLQNVPEQ